MTTVPLSRAKTHLAKLLTDVEGRPTIALVVSTMRFSVSGDESWSACSVPPRLRP